MYPDRLYQVLFEVGSSVEISSNDLGEFGVVSFRLFACTVLELSVASVTRMVGLTTWLGDPISVSKCF